MATVATERFSPSPPSTLLEQVRGSVRHAVALLALTACAGGLLGTAAFASRQLERAPVASAAHAVPVYLPNVEFLRLVSLGYENALANVLWFRTISYFGEHYRSDRLYPWLARMCDVVTDLDPRAEHVYHFAGVILPWEANRPDEGIALLTKGIGAFPESWQFHFFLGFNYFFFKNDLEQATGYVRRATELPGAHPFVSRLAALLYAEQYGPETARAFLQELQASPEADDMHAVIEDHLKRLELTEQVQAIESAVATYRRERGRLPASLDELVRDRLLASIPREPFGGEYRYDAATGAVSSSTGHRRERLHTSRNRSRVLSGERLF